jgi:hypothetical protein
MKKLFVLFLAIIFIGCSNPLNVRVDDPKALQSVEAIMSTLPAETAKEFKKEYKDVLILGVVANGEVAIIDRYLKKYEYLTLGDLLDVVQKKNQ